MENKKTTESNAAPLSILVGFWVMDFTVKVHKYVTWAAKLSKLSLLGKAILVSTFSYTMWSEMKCLSVVIILAYFKH